MNGAIIRDWEARDRAAVRTLGAGLQAHERRLRPSRAAPGVMLDTWLAEIEAWFDDPDRAARVFVAEAEGGIVGFLGCRLDHDILEAAPPELAIRELFVAEGWRRRGVARALFAAARAHAATLGVTRMTVAVLTGNDEAQAAYVALGFQPALVTFESTG